MFIIAAMAGFSGGIMCGAALAVLLLLLNIVPRTAHMFLTEVGREAGAAFAAGAVSACFITFSGAAIDIPAAAAAAVSLLLGMFIGIMLSSLAEFLDVFPAVPGHISFSYVMLISFAAGKLAGGLLYFLTPYWAQGG